MKGRAIWWVAVALLLAAGVVLAATSLAATWPLSRLPLWDGAGNGWGAVELWSALRAGHPLEFLIRANAQDKWPFGFSLLTLPFVAVGGASFESATLLPALAFALVPALLLWAARQFDDGPRGVAAGVTAGVLWLASPLPRALATVVMRETTGAALSIAVLASYRRARRVGTLAAWRLFGLLALALFLTKYNYFLLSTIPLVAYSWHMLDADERAAVRARTADAIFRRGWSSPARWLALVASVTLVTIAAGRNPGGLIYGVEVIATLTFLSLQWKHFRRWRERITKLENAPRALLETLVVPIWIWWLSPDPIHPKNFFSFLRNRPADEPLFSIDSLLAPVRSLIVDYSLGQRFGALIGVASLVGSLLVLARRRPRRALALTALLGFGLIVLHPMKEGRFLATVAPALFLAAAFAIADLLGGLRPAYLARAALLLLTLGAAGALVVLPFDSERSDRLLSDHRQLTGESELAAPLEELAGRLHGKESAAFFGAANELSESLVRWRILVRSGEETALLERPMGIDADTPETARVATLEAWLTSERPERIVALQPLPGSRWLADGDYLRYNAWQSAWLSELEAGGRWRPLRPERYPALGLKVASWFPARAPVRLPEPTAPSAPATPPAP